jgi:anti-sigma factor RsiW
VLDQERNVAGVWCSEVLERLSEFVDGDLPPDVEATLRAHVAGCDVCERFGGVFASLVTSLRRQPDDDIDPAVAGRLRARLQRDAR